MNAEKRFAERLQELVYDCGLKPEEISALCGVGLSRLRCWLSPRCASLPCTRSLVKLADFFGCSLLYLLGFEEENSLTRPRANLPDFSKRLLFLKERHEIKIYMLKRTGRLGAASSFYNWTKRGSLPDVYNLLALSDVFRCTPDFFARQRGLKVGLKAATQKTANLKTTKKRAFKRVFYYFISERSCFTNFAIRSTPFSICSIA